MTTVSRIAAVAALLPLFGMSGPVFAEEGLPEGVFANGNGCQQLAKKRVEDINDMAFIMFNSKHLIGLEIGCVFDSVAPKTTGGHRAWAIKGRCEAGGGAKPAAFAVVEEQPGQLAITMQINGNAPDPLGRFFHCPKVVE